MLACFHLRGLDYEQLLDIANSLIDLLIHVGHMASEIILISTESSLQVLFRPKLETFCVRSD